MGANRIPIQGRRGAVKPTLRLTLLADGSSDACLLLLLRWLVGAIAEQVQIESAFADLGFLQNPPRTLEAKIKKSVEMFPCDILFVHRDAEAQAPDDRIREISSAIVSATIQGRWVPVVPVRMTEAWLLIDESAIRQAASNPNGTIPLCLPPPSRIESIPSPKAVLHHALETASGRNGRRLQQFRRDIGRHVQRVAQFIRDKEPLRTLGAFRRLEADTRKALRGLVEKG